MGVLSVNKNVLLNVILFFCFTLIVPFGSLKKKPDFFPIFFVAVF